MLDLVGFFVKNAMKISMRICACILIAANSFMILIGIDNDNMGISISASIGLIGGIIAFLSSGNA